MKMHIEWGPWERISVAIFGKYKNNVKFSEPKIVK